MLKQQQHQKSISRNQNEVIPKTRPLEKITPQNNHDTSKGLPNTKVHKSGNYPSLKQNKET